MECGVINSLEMPRKVCKTVKVGVCGNELKLVYLQAIECFLTKVVVKEKDNMGLESNAGIAFHHRG